jgi:hypothetical protein
MRPFTDHDTWVRRHAPCRHFRREEVFADNTRQIELTIRRREEMAHYTGHSAL